MNISRYLIGAICAASLSISGLALANANSADSSDMSKCPKGGAGSGGSASTDEMMGSQGKSQASNLRTVTITVKSTDAKNHKVTFEAQVKPEANITSDGKPIALDRLQEGDTVRASFDPTSGELVKVMVVRKMSGAGSSAGSSDTPSDTSSK